MSMKGREDVDRVVRHRDGGQERRLSCRCEFGLARALQHEYVPQEVEHVSKV